MHQFPVEEKEAVIQEKRIFFKKNDLIPLKLKRYRKIIKLLAETSLS
jgi:hypothetical protein